LGDEMNKIKKILLTVLSTATACEIKPAHPFMNSTFCDEQVFAREMIAAYCTAVIAVTGLGVVAKLLAQTRRNMPIQNQPFWGIAEDQGIRPSMEDTHIVKRINHCYFFGLYDGHRGRTVADFAAQNVHLQFKKYFKPNKKKRRTKIPSALHRSFM